jgi:excisionase family DNA binding protein
METEKNTIKPLLKAKETAKILNVPLGEFYKTVRAGLIPDGVLVRVGVRRLRFDEDALRTWIERGGNQPN